MNDGQAGGSEGGIDQFISICTLGTAVARIVEFDDKPRLHRLGIAQNKVNMFSINSIGMF